MRKIATILCFFLISIATVFAGVGIGIREVTPGDIHVIAIGVNKYPGQDLPALRFCVPDAEYIVQKLLHDNPRIKNQDLKDGNGNSINHYNVENIYKHLLTDENATIENIRDAFKEVIANSSTNDYFVFMFSGYSTETVDNETFIIPYLESLNNNYTMDSGLKLKGSNHSNLLSLVEIAKLMEQIPSQNQLIISEAGNGNSFAQNLISELFESNPLIAAGTERNRIIITTRRMGREGGSCADGSSLSTGYLMKYILSNGNLLDAFSNLEEYEFWLTRSEMMCPSTAEKYIATYNEANYRNILLKNFRKSGKRGSKSIIEKKPEVKEIDNISNTYAFILATENYNKEQTDWSDLKNPINDADAIANVLESKYQAKVKKVYNKTKNEVIADLLQFNEQIDENDKLIFFVAGHGYYSKPFSDGFLVMQDSYSLSSDLSLESYLSMATLNRLLDGVASKNVFSIFDVCYGASFELNNANLSIENYSNTKMDQGLDNFISEKDKNTSRIVLASGQYEVFDYWKDSQKHSPFADKLIKALEEETEFISPGKIFSYVQGNATTPILKQFGKHEPRGDFLLKVN